VVDDPGSDDPVVDDPGTDDPGTSDPGTSDPGTGSGSGSTPDPGSSSPGTDEPGAPSAPVVVSYPEVGPFGLTSISPAVVSTAGGTRVTITGTNVPAGVRVLIGDSRAATVVSSTSTSVVFTAPSAVAGTYDVHVFNAAGTAESVLPGGLRYVADPGTGGTTPDAGPGSTPGTGAGGAGSDEDDDTTTNPVPGGTAGPVTTPGPHGQRLVRSAAFGSLGASFWSVDCSSGCRGVLL
jgi:hypothetical protein